MIEYTSPNGYTGQLYGKSNFRIVDQYGKEVFHTGFRAIETEAELKEEVDTFPEFLRLLEKAWGELENEDIERLRIHATGDFITGEAKKYYELLKEFSHIKAWTYTKVTNDSDIELLDSLPNCNVVKSIIKGYGFNFGHVPYIANVYYYLKRNNKSVYICRCGIDSNQHCSNCDGCSDHDYVLFLEHSTGYKAESDYGFQKMVDLIESQKGN